MRRPCRIFDADVNVHEGCFHTKKGRNTGSLNQSGYRLINLKKRGERLFGVYTLHFAVFCEANNISELPKGFCLHHIDDNPQNNKIDNLCLCTPTWNNYCAAKNRDYSKIYQTRKRNGFKQTIKAFTKEGGEMLFSSMCKAAKHFGVNPSRISRIVNKKKYSGSVLKDGTSYSFSRV